MVKQLFCCAVFEMTWFEWMRYKFGCLLRNRRVSKFGVCRDLCGNKMQLFSFTVSTPSPSLHVYGIFGWGRKEKIYKNYWCNTFRFNSMPFRTTKHPGPYIMFLLCFIVCFNTPISIAFRCNCRARQTQHGNTFQLYFRNWFGASVDSLLLLLSFFSSSAFNFNLLRFWLNCSARAHAHVKIYTSWFSCVPNIKRSELI